VRATNLLVLQRLDEAAWQRVGRVSTGEATPRGIAYVMAGHVRHHFRVLRERYGL